MLVIAACWLVFLLTWAISAFTVKRTAGIAPLRARIEYQVPLNLGIGAVILGIGKPHAWAPIGEAACATGLALALWARFTLGRNWSARVEVKVEHDLVKVGPYRSIRHPIYTAILMMVAGTVIATGNIVSYSGLALIVVGCVLKANLEETLMEMTFPLEYPEYRSRTTRLIPFLF